MKRLGIGAIVAMTVIGLVGATQGVASASVGVQGAASYSSNGTVISGWNWLASSDDTATWTFDITGISPAQKEHVYLNVSALVTNKTNGGSGFSARAVKFVITCGSSKQKVEVKLDNHFRPIAPDDSSGIGYAAYGASSARVHLDQWGMCTAIDVSVKGPFAAGRHIGVNQGAVVLGYR